MKYLLLMYHPETYWSTHSHERDEQEEAAFATFCTWMRENRVTWSAMALDPPQAKYVRASHMRDATSRMLPEVTDIITGLFILDVPNDALVSEILDHCPHIDGSRLEIRSISG